MAPNRKILITGGTGFIGSALTRFLADQGHKEIFVLSRNAELPESLKSVETRVELVQGDILKPASYVDALKELSPGVVYHLAWYVAPGDYLTSPLNLEYLKGSLDFAKNAFESGTSKMITAGTCFEYNIGRERLVETAREKPRHLYSATKLALKVVLEQMSCDYNAISIWARLFYQYGEYENKNRLVPYLLDSLLKDREVRLRSHGLQERNYMHISDVAQGLALLLKENQTSVYNIGSDRSMSIRKFVGEMEGILGKGGLVKFAPEDTPFDEPPFICANNAKLKSLGFRERYSLRQYLSEVLSKTKWTQ